MPPAVAPEVTPPSPENARKIELAQAFAFHLHKGIKQIGMYRHNEARFPEFLGKAITSVTEFTGEFGPMSLKVDQQNFLLLGQPVFAEDSALPYKFYREGIRQLIFRPGISVEELVAFTLIALSEPERGSDEVLAQLWKAALPHIEYVVVEGFTMEGIAEEETEVEVDKIVSYLYGRLKTSSEDYLRFARVSAEDLDSKLEGIDQIRGVVVGGESASAQLKAKIQADLREEEESRLFPKLIAAVFQVIESGVEDAALLGDMFVQLLDAMLLQEDFASINQIVLKLRALEQREGGTSDSLTRLRESLVSKMGEEQRLMRVGEVLRTSRPKHPQDVARYLQALDTAAVPTMISALESVELPENRALLIDVLARHAADFPEPFIHRLESDKPQVVRDMVAILERTNSPDKAKLFAPVLRHPNVALRLEAMTLIARSRTAECYRLLYDALEDPSNQVRIVATRLLPQMDREKAYQDLNKLIRAPNFDKKSPEERGAAFYALGSTGLPGAYSHFSALLATKPNLLNRKRVLEDKLLAVQGLQGTQNVQGYRALEQLVEDRNQPVEVLVAARRSMGITRKALWGDSAPEGV